MAGVAAPFAAAFGSRPPSRRAAAGMVSARRAVRSTMETATKAIAPAVRADGLENRGARSHRVPGGGLQEGSGVLHRAHGVDAPQRRWQAGGDGHRRLGLGHFQAGGATGAPAAASARRRGGRGRGARAIVESFGFAIEPWNAKTVEAELRKRGLTPDRRQRRQGLRELPREGSGRLRPADRQRQRPRKARKAGQRREAVGAGAVRRRPDGRPCGWTTSRSASTNYKESASFYTNLLGWKPTYDEGSQNELMIGDVGDIIIRGGNPLDPNSARAGARAARASITSRSASRRGTPTA